MNCLGSIASRKEYTQALLKYLEPFHNELDEDSLKRLDKNPLRILDSKIPTTQEIVKNAPKLVDFIDNDELVRFEKTCKFVESLGVDYSINKNLVRGLDYYSGLVFEWTTDKLGAQSAVCAGGRYDTLVENLGGQKTSAIGFAIGIERLLLLLEELGKLNTQEERLDVFFVVDEATIHQSMVLINSIRSELKDLNIEMDLKSGSMKSQFKKADKSGARIAIVIGSQEIENKKVNIKYLQQDKPQQSVAFDELLNFLESNI